MFDSIWHDVRHQFRHGNMVTRLIIANLAVFVAFALMWLVAFLLRQSDWLPTAFSDWLGMSSNWHKLLWKPWTPLTSMFLHLSPGHIIWNLLFLYWFGRIVGDLIGDQRVLPIYLLGGLGGGLAYFVGINIYDEFGIDHVAYGASAAVAAIMVAAGFLAPDYNFRLLLIGDVKLKYVVAFTLLLFIVGLAGRDNTGGQFAHLGGAFTGWLFVQQLRSGNDWSIPVNRLIDRLMGLFSSTRREKPPLSSWRNPTPPPKTRGTGRRPSGGPAPSSGPDQSRIDAILDKIKEHGYDNLTAEEKEDLFRASK